MRVLTLGLIVLSAPALAAETGTDAAAAAANAAANAAAKAAPAQEAPAAPEKAAPAAPAPTTPSSVTEITLEAAMAIQLQNSKALGLTVYKGQAMLLPGLNELGLPAKLPDPVMPGIDETAAATLPPSDAKAKADAAADAASQ
jgi:hypothetical protein